jgi:hypothetical protein
MIDQSDLRLPSTERITEVYNQVLAKFRQKNIKTFPIYKKPVLLCSDTYPGAWLEACHDALFWGEFDGYETTKSHLELFLEFQKEDGQLPCLILDESNSHAEFYLELHPYPVWYQHVQEVVSFFSLALETAKRSGDLAFLKRSYNAGVRWDRWISENRNTRGTGLVEMFCEWDMGFDRCPRVTDGGIPHTCPNGDPTKIPDLDFMPLLAPDMSAVAYGNRMALAEMAELLDKPKEASIHRDRAMELRELILKYCYDPEDDFFYDVNSNGKFRKYRTIHIAWLFQEHVLEQPMADRIYHRYLRNPDEFWTEYPFPSVSISDPCFPEPFDTKTLSAWNGWTMGPSQLRLLLWMDYYGKSSDLEIIMQTWVKACCREIEVPFSEGINPRSGEFTKSSPYLSCSMLFFLYSVKRLGLAGKAD